MTARKEGKAQLTRQNLTDSSQNQLWVLTPENCLENVGYNHRNMTPTKYVLDVLDNAGGVLMMCPRSPERNATQKWRFTNVINNFNVFLYLTFRMDVCVVVSLIVMLN